MSKGALIGGFNSVADCKPHDESSIEAGPLSCAGFVFRFSSSLLSVSFWQVFHVKMDKARPIVRSIAIQCDVINGGSRNASCGFAGCSHKQDLFDWTDGLPFTGPICCDVIH